MAGYIYECRTEECSEFKKEKEVWMSISEYSEEKLPKCEVCGNKTFRVYTPLGHQTFGDGYKS